jgi:excisionase family DNA binding protein
VGRNGQSKAPEQLQLSFTSPYLTIEQVASLLGVPKSFIYRRTARGHGDPIPHYRLGGHLRFRLDDIETWIENHRSEEPAQPPALVAATRRRSATSTRQRLVRRTPPA